MASKSSTTSAFILIFLIFSLAEADLLASPSSAMTDNFGTCPRDPLLQLGVCANLPGLPNIFAGDPRARACCDAIQGLPNIQVADCLCYVFRPIPLVFAIDEAIREIFFACNRVFPIGFQCPPPAAATFEMAMD